MQISSNAMQLTSREADGVLERAAAFDCDSSLCGLIRAIVLDHEGFGDSFFKQCALKSETLSMHDNVIRRMKGAMGTTLIRYAGSISETFEADGWETFDDAPCYLNRYLSQVTPSKIYINRNTRSVVAIIYGQVTHKWLQAFESVLWAVFPWYYKKDDETIKFFRTFAIDNKEVTEEEAKRVLIDYVNQVAEKNNFRERLMNKVLDGYSKEIVTEKIATQAYLVQEKIDEIDRTTDKLKKLYNQLSDAELVLQGLRKVSVSEEGTKLNEFFSKHKNLTVPRIDGSTMRYGIVDTLEFYDTEEAKNLFDNEYSWVNDEYSAQTIEWLRDVFVERRGIIRVSAYFYLEDARLVSPARSECPEENSMPNPHIYFFGCSGANDVYYSQYAKSGDWELAIEQSIAATKNWAVGDVAVSRKMFNWLINHDLVKCIYVTDGSPLERVTKDCKLVSLKEFVEITNRKKDEEKNTEEGEKSNG